jgi:predicted N-formylglutamate amidohydrolase
LTDGPVVIAVHSCEPEMGGVTRPWPVGIISQWDQRFAKRIIAKLEAAGVNPVGDNEPYDGRSAAGFTVTYHGAARRLHHVGLEVRKDVLESADGVARWAGLLADSLSATQQEMAP